MKYLSLFSGIGGFELGIANSDIEMECIGFSEVDKNAKSIYRKWFPDHRDLGDATKIRPEDLDDFDLLVAGFPCQPFSNAGTRGGLDDTRGTLFFEIARICQEKRPQYLLLENVLGLLSNDKGRTFQKFLGILAEMGYLIQWEVRNSKNYGVPQNRERVFIKGYLRGRGRSEVLRIGEDQREASAKCEQVEIARPVVKRKHDCDIGELKKTLRDARKKSGYTMNEIADHFGLPKTHVEHWFRRDNSFAIPNVEYWYDLKEYLDIQTNGFDAFVTEFEVLDGVYEKNKRAYLEHGLAPTITSSGGEIVGVQRENPGVDVVVPGKQATRVMSPNGVSVTLCGNAGGLGGKCLDINTLIPHPNGFSRLKDIHYGQYVFDEKGQPCQVTYVSPVYNDHKCYEIEFINGEKIICDEDHIWNVSTMASRKSNQRAKNPIPLYQNIKVKDMLDDYIYTKPSGRQQYNYRVKNTDIVEYPTQDLPIPPYTLGAWLGDGISKGGAICGMDDEIFDKIREDGFELRLQKHSVLDNNRAIIYGILGLQKLLRENNLIRNKHIPIQYIIADKNQRLELISGLMDTDGTIRPNGSMSFCNTNKRIIDDMVIILSSLGISCNVTQKRKTKESHQQAYEIAFITELPIFNVVRKKERQKEKITNIKKMRSIVNIKEVPPVSVKCIKVNSESELFLCSEWFIPTHNTGLYAIPKPVGNYSERNHGAAKVYDTEGISPTLTATNYKHPITIREDTRKIRKVSNSSPNGHHGKDVFDPDGLSPTLCGESLYKNGIKIAQPVLTPDRVNKRQNGRRMKEDGEPMFTLTAQDKHGVFDGYDFRRLTPLETERLQAFPDEWTKFGENGEEISDTQRYRCTGNAVTTSVITYIINEMFGK